MFKDGEEKRVFWELHAIYDDGIDSIWKPRLEQNED
jgi:hypothetical protein